MSDRFLTDDELVEATGSPQKSLQKEVLDQNRIFYIQRRDGSIKTTWYHINHPMQYIVLPAGSQPVAGMNFGAIES